MLGCDVGKINGGLGMRYLHACGMLMFLDGCASFKQGAVRLASEDGVNTRENTSDCSSSSSGDRLINE